MSASADPERHNTIATRHIAEAMQYRRNLWQCIESVAREDEKAELTACK